jgi:hypothetical protein
VQDLIDQALAKPPGPPPRFSLNNIEIDDGSITVDDAMTGRKHHVERLAIGIPFLSSLPYATEIRVTPRLEGAFNGSHFSLAGNTVPFGEPREASLDVDLDALALPEYLAYLPTRPRVDLTGGALTTRLKVVFVDGKPGERKLEVRGEARVDGLKLARRDGTSLASADRIAVALNRVDVFNRLADIDLVAVVVPKVDVKRLQDGSLEVAGPWFDAPPKRAAPAEAPGAPWTVNVAKAGIQGGALDLSDEGSGFHSSLVDVTVDATNLSTKRGSKVHVALAFVTDDRIASFKGEADVDPFAPAAAGTFELAKFSLGLLFPYYKDVLAVDVQQGSLDLASRFTLEPDGSIKLSEGKSAIANLALAYPGAKQPFWRFPQIDASGIDVDVRGRNVKVGELASHNAVVKVARERNGSIDVARLMKTTTSTGTNVTGAAGTTSVAGATAATRDDRTWTLAFGKLAVDHASFDFEDRMPDPAVKLTIRDFTFNAANWSNARDARSTVSLRARVGNRGSLAWNGTLATNPVAAAGRIDASGLDLVQLRPYIESRANVSVAAGALAVKGALTFDLPENAPPRGTWKGDVAITDFAALDKPTASDLARFKRLVLEGIDVASAPFRLAITRIGAEDYYARMIVYQDGTLNITRLLSADRAPEPPPDAKPPPPSASPPRDALPITIGRIELANGNINYSDFFVHPNYAANLTEVTGSVTTMSAQQAGDVAITARVDHSAPVEISGRVHPFAKDLSLDIAAKARDIDLPPLTPYSVKYAGYGIEKGKLTFDVHYRVQDRKLAAENRLVLDQLTFNPQRVDSETATKLPVLLAVALLKDRHGVIDIELPISGSLDDPQFSVGGLIVRVIINLIGKAVTAPFALLGAVFGHGEELSNVPFAPGSAALGDDAQKRVDTLAKALADRPALKLEIGGRADGSVDREAMRHGTVDTAMKREKMKALVAAGNAPPSLEEVAIGADERTKWLTAAYKESSIKTRPRNFVGMLKDVPPDEMESMLLAEAKVDDDALRLLANARAQSVKDALVAKGIASERLFLTVPKLGGDAAGGARAEGAAAPPARVDLALR